jgi:hypothetical protein
MAAHDVAFSRPEVSEKVRAVASRARSSTWLTTGPGCVAVEDDLAATFFGRHGRMLRTPREGAFHTSGDQYGVGFHRTRDDAEAVRAYLRGLLPDYRPLTHPIPVQVAAPYADDY